MSLNRTNSQDRFFMEVGEAMFWHNMRSFINVETLRIEIYPTEDYFGEVEEEDLVKEALEHPEKFLAIEQRPSSEAFEVMAAFARTLKDRQLKSRLVNALERKRPFANFKFIIDNSSVRQEWFKFKDEAYAEFAKEWIEENADDELKEKIKSLA
jgi:hypothetical protein